MGVAGFEGGILKKQGHPIKAPAKNGTLQNAISQIVKEKEGENALDINSYTAGPLATRYAHLVHRRRTASHSVGHCSRCYNSQSGSRSQGSVAEVA